MSPQNSDNTRHEQFVALLAASHGKLLGYLMSILGRWHDAEDVLQRASVLMWQKFDTFELGTDFVAWAGTIAFYEARNFQRLAARSPLHFDDALLEALAAERLQDLSHAEARADALEHCLKKLRDTDRSLLLTAYRDHGGVAALAERLKRAPQTLYNKLNIIRRLLAECVQQRLAAEVA
jgi:RNA polymerase sigma-70 factor (ECF subfamily)